ncbi:MAG: hypothetical protein HN531_01360 [Opitutae bacterium]|nr:hypothetical protein [Opitutae bacterium]
MKKILVTIVLAWIPLLAIQAKPLDLSKVSRDANWLMHMDFDAMRKSEIGSFMLESMEKMPEAVERMEKMKKKYGVDVDEFSYLTMSGTGEQHKGIAIMKGGVDTDMLVDLVKSQDSVEVSRIGKQKVYSSDRGRHSMAFAPLNKGVIVGGPDADYVSEGIDLAKGKAPSYKGHDLLDVLAGQMDKPGFLFFADVKGAAKNNELDPRAMLMLEKVKAGGMAVGDDGGSISFVAVMEATDEETCKQVEAMVRGGMAMLDMRKAQDKRLEKVLDGHSIKRDGKMLWVKMKFSVEAIMDHLEREMRKAA